MGNDKLNNDNFCMKGMDFYYVLDNPLRGMLDYEKMASTERGRQKLNLNGSSLECLLFVFTEGNNIGTILPSGKVFGGTGPLYPDSCEKTLEESAETIKSKISSWFALYKGEPRAIVYHGQENNFIAVAGIVGMNPVRLGENLFSEGFDS